MVISNYRVIELSIKELRLIETALNYLQGEEHLSIGMPFDWTPEL